MIVLDEEIKRWFRLFNEVFGDVVPVRQISGRVTNAQLIDAIKKSIEAGENLLPTIFGYGGDEGLEY
jgi:hypothetical protein